MKYSWQTSEWKKDSVHIAIYLAIILQSDNYINLHTYIRKTKTRPVLLTSNRTFQENCNAIHAFCCNM